jgi:AraC-like DNA-binding protein
MKLYIKHMVSTNCKMVVKEQLTRLGISYVSINLGEIELTDNIPSWQREELKLNLKEYGLELMDDAKSILVEKIKNSIIELVRYAEEIPNINFSEYLSQKLNYNYTYLSNVFSKTQSITIEHFMIVHKIERVKELITYNELNLTQISWKLHYSSVAHLSYQFKKVTGLTPSFFKKMKHQQRIKSINE